MSKLGFVRGTIGICTRCGDEVNVQKHLRGVHPEQDHVHYAVAHPCGFHGDLVVDRKVHQSTIEYLKQVSQGMRDTGSPVSEDERKLEEFRTQLETIKTGDDVERQFNRGPGFG